jgi:hypothetical protein
VTGYRYGDAMSRSHPCEHQEPTHLPSLARVATCLTSQADISALSVSPLRAPVQHKSCGASGALRIRPVEGAGARGNTYTFEHRELTLRIRRTNAALSRTLPNPLSRVATTS